MTTRLDLRRQDGVAMIVAIGVMSVLLLLTATVIGASTMLGTSTSRETLNKRAFEAAEAGLQATIYRLNMLAPAHNMCIGGAAETVQAPSGAACSPYSEDLGNGATFQSWTTPELSVGGSCAGSQVGTSSSIAERCVTSAGTVDGVTRRVQARVASYASAPPFPISGVVGLSSVHVDENSRIVGGSGSNGQVTVDNNGVTSSITLGPSAPAPIIRNNGVPGPIYRRTVSQGPFALAPVDPGNSATVNDNGRISNAFANPRISPFDSVSGGVTWNATERTLSLGNNASVTIGGGIYNFCSLSLSNNATITLAPGARTAIYIDSPQRAGSACAASTGTFSMGNNSSFVNNSPPVAGSGFAHDPTALQLYIVGRTGSAVTIRNNSSFYGTVYAPTSTLNIQNNAATYGAFSANSINVSNNATITADPNATNIRTSGGGVFFRSAWRECSRVSETADPSAGC